MAELDEHGETRLQLVADPVEARPERRVGAEQGSDQQLRASERIDHQRDHRDERRCDQRARPRLARGVMGRWSPMPREPITDRARDPNEGDGSGNAEVSVGA